jgi:DinB superfamily
VADPNPPDPRSLIEEWARRPRQERLGRLRRTADDLAVTLRDSVASALTRRPDAKNWAPIEVLCHLRDAEESFLDRLRQIMATDEPHFPSVNPNRVAEEREYLRQDAGEALAAFRRHREGSLAFFGALTETDWSRAGHQMDSRGRRTLDDFLSVMAWHDENHLAQLARALRGEA